MEQEKTSCLRAYGLLVKNHFRGILLLIVPLVLLPLIVPNYERHFRCLYIFALMSIFWLTDALPAYVTGLLPVVMMPFMGLLDSSKVTKCYMTPSLIIFLGSNMLALAIKFSRLSERIAIGLITMIGCSPRRLLLGLILTTGFASMWMRNTAVVAFMLPITKAVLDEFQAGGLKMQEEKKLEQQEEDREASTITTGYYLAVCYAATIGGCGTLIGTATNLAFKGIYEISYRNATEHITFHIFIAYNLPWVIIALLFLYLTLLITHFGLYRPQSAIGVALKNFSTSSTDVAKAFKQKFEDLGSMSSQEIQVSFIFMLMISLLLFQSPDIMSGWADVLRVKRYIVEATPVVFIILLLFYLPANYTFFKYCCGNRQGPFSKTLTPLLSWKYVNQNFPWGVIFTLGGGYALSEAFLDSGLSFYLQKNIKCFDSLPLPALQVIVVVFAALVTTCCGNVAAANITVNIVNEVARSAKTHPLNLIYPAGLGSSIAFLLPVSTPGNRLVAEYTKINTRKMSLAGIAPTFIAILLISITCISLHFVLYSEAKEFPIWATLQEK